MAEDLNILRALGYPLAADAQLTERADITEFNLNGATAELTVPTAADRWYRIATSRDLQNWTILPQSVQGTGASLNLPVSTTDSSQFLQVVAVP